MGQKWAYFGPFTAIKINNGWRERWYMKVLMSRIKKFPHYQTFLGFLNKPLLFCSRLSTQLLLIGRKISWTISILIERDFERWIWIIYQFWQLILAWFIFRKIISKLKFLFAGLKKFRSNSSIITTKIPNYTQMQEFSGIRFSTMRKE